MNEVIRLTESTGSITFSPDFAIMYSAPNNKVRILRADTQIIIREYEFVLTPDLAGTSPDGRLVYGSERATNKVIVINNQGGTLEPGYGVGFGLNGMVVGLDGQQLFALTTEQIKDPFSVAVIDALTQQLVKKIPVGRIAMAIAINPVDSKLWVCCAGVTGTDEGVYVVDPQTESVTHISVDVSVFGGIVLDAKNNLAYISYTELGHITVIDTKTYAVKNTYSLGERPTKMSLSQDSSLLYLLNQTSGLISVVNTKDMSPARNIETEHNDLRVITTQKNNGTIWVGYFA